jgi:hypothetical protein
VLRSAKRSVPAARAATAEGYTAYNISFGFLGVLDKATGESRATITPTQSHGCLFIASNNEITNNAARRRVDAHAGQYHGGWTSDPALPWRQDII